MMGAYCLEGKINVVESHRSNNMTGKWICKTTSSKWKAHPLSGEQRVPHKLLCLEHVTLLLCLLLSP